MTKLPKILYVATSDIHISIFHLEYLKYFSEKGYEVHIACENRGGIDLPYSNRIIYFNFPRSLMNINNLYSYRKLKELINFECYDLVHCHTPIPSMLTRLAAREARKKGTKVLYTAHGFHFYKGAPLKMWMTYYPAEYFLSKFTDAIITINQEDFNYVNNKMLHKDSYYIKGIGVDSNKFILHSPEIRKELKTQYGYDNEFILLYIAEFIYRKNHQFIIESIPELKKEIPNLKVIFAGKGILLEKMKLLVDNLKISQTVDFIGFRTDLGNLAAIADVGISASRQEGLGLGLAEQMLCGIPIVATEDRGHREMIINGENGYLFPQNNKSEFINCILNLERDSNLKIKLGENAHTRAKLFTIENSLKSMIEIYSNYLFPKN